MRTFDLSPLLSSTVGFDRLVSLLDSATQGRSVQNSYPPYNISRKGEHEYCITLAVAGFSENDLTIEEADHTLTVSGQQSKECTDTGMDFLHQGIAARDFERQFQLNEYVKVTHAFMENGLLNINLVQEVPEAMKPHKISIDPPPLQNSASNDVLINKKVGKAA